MGMRAVEWIYQRWQRTGYSAAELGEASGIGIATIFRIQSAGTDRLQRNSYTPSPAIIRSLAGPLQYGPAATKFLIESRNDEFDAEALDTLAGPVVPTKRTGAAHRGVEPPMGQGLPSASYATLESVESLGAELRQELHRLRLIVAGFARVAEDGGRAAREALAGLSAAPTPAAEGVAHVS